MKSTIELIKDAVTSFFAPLTGKNPYKDSDRYSMGRGNGPNEKLFDQLKNKGCPDCGCRDFDQGPEAGLSVNIRCSNQTCHSEYNIAPMMGWAERIKQ